MIQNNQSTQDFQKQKKSHTFNQNDHRLEPTVTNFKLQKNDKKWTKKLKNNYRNMTNK